MSGEPTDPVSFDGAVAELWERLATKAGLDLKQHRLRSPDDLSPEEGAEFDRNDARLASLRDEAWEWLWGSTFTERLRVWVYQDRRWKRLPLEAVRESHFEKAEDEPWRVYLDRLEIAAAAAPRWPIYAGELDGPSLKKESEEDGGSKRKAGRPRGSGGYAKSDDPLLLEMRQLLKDGAANSVHDAAIKVSPKAQGAELGRVSRLCKRYFEKYGRE